MVTQVGLQATKGKQFQLCVNSAKNKEQDYTVLASRNQCAESFIEERP